MGDFAKRIGDGEMVKIGTCGAMYYCRWEQSDMIYDCDFNKEGCLWRIPLPSEDGTAVGEYEYGSLVRNGNIPYDLQLDLGKLSAEDCDSLAEGTGSVYAEVKELAMRIKVPCHHGFKVPNTGDTGFKVFGGMKNTLHLCFLKNDEKELRIGVRCYACENMWLFSFDELEPCIVSLEMKKRLFVQCVKYWMERNEGWCRYGMTFEDEKRMIELYNDIDANGDWIVWMNGELVMKADVWKCYTEFCFLTLK